MTRGSIREYTEAVRGRYLGAGKKEKGRMLDEFTQVTGYHRKAAVRLLRRGNLPRSVKRQGRPRRYGPEVAETLKAAWEATDRLEPAQCRALLIVQGLPRKLFRAA
ncbi:MAG TPA: hypothetical protein VMX96_03890 [Dehalococcoidia bacterium]|nr:hypothetical protein [Dehalococcoidia bacterium]